MLTKYGLPLIAVALLIFAALHVARAQKESPAGPPPADPPRTPYANNVAGSGMVEAQTENIAIGSPVPGIVVEVFCRVGDEVKAGDRLFRLDDRQLRADLRTRQAALISAKAELTRLQNEPRPEEVLMSKAAVTEAEANVADMRDQYQRAKTLTARRVTTEEELLRREQAYRAAQAKLDKANADLAMQLKGAGEYDIEVAKAAVEQAQAQVDAVNIELDRLVIQARDNGRVLQVNVRPGEFVGAPANQALIVLGDVDRLHVRVDISEYDIHRFRTDTPARAMLKGQPGITFPLTFVRVEPYVIPKKSLTGSNSERVDTRVLQVIYSLEPQDHRVYVGQQVDVFIEATETAKVK
jgi:HlyD family secretion protein